MLKVYSVVASGGQCREVKCDKHGHLYFSKGYWSKLDLEEITELLGSDNGKERV